MKTDLKFVSVKIGPCQHDGNHSYQLVVGHANGRSEVRGQIKVGEVETVDYTESDEA